MKQSCVSFTANQPILVIRQEFTEICNDVCAGALLSYLCYWHDIKLQSNKQASSYNDQAEKHGESRSQLETLLQWHTADELKNAMLGVFGRPAINKGVNILVGLGFISVHKNPNPRYRFDKTKHFLVNIPAVNQAIKSKNQPSIPIDRNCHTVESESDETQNVNLSTDRNCQTVSHKLLDVMTATDTAIPKTTSKTTTKTKLLETMSGRPDDAPIDHPSDSSLSHDNIPAPGDSGITELFDNVPPETRSSPEPEITSPPRGICKSTARHPDVERVFDHWQRRMKKPRAKLLASRIKRIQASLKLGYSADDLIQAIDGCASSAHHMGDNNRGTRYDGLDLILRDGEKIEWFMGMTSPVTEFNGRAIHEHDDGLSAKQRRAKESRAHTKRIIAAGIAAGEPPPPF